MMKQHQVEPEPEPRNLMQNEREALLCVYDDYGKRPLLCQLGSPCDGTFGRSDVERTLIRSSATVIRFRIDRFGNAVVLQGER